jgi:hypothetical protein
MRVSNYVVMRYATSETRGRELCTSPFFVTARLRFWGVECSISPNRLLYTHVSLQKPLTPSFAVGI